MARDNTWVLGRRDFDRVAFEAFRDELVKRGLAAITVDADTMWIAIGTNERLPWGEAADAIAHALVPEREAAIANACAQERSDTRTEARGWANDIDDLCDDVERGTTMPEEALRQIREIVAKAIR